MKLLRLLFLFLVGASTVAFAQSNPVPFVNQPLVPLTTIPGSSGFTLTVNGTGFVNGAVVKWNGTPLTTIFVSGSQLAGTVPAANVASAGSASVTVTNPAPGGGVSQALYFDVSLPVSGVNFTSLPPSTGGSGTTSVITADFNGDGKLDLAEVGYGLTIQLGNGDGTFQDAVTYDVGAFLCTPVVGDFNGNGNVDIVTTGCGPNNEGLLVFLGKGDGTFQPPLYTSLSGPIALAVGDFNGDGKLDLAGVCQGVSGCTQGGIVEGVIAIFLGNGDGTFQKEIDYLPPVWSGPSFIVDSPSLALGDFNRDGKLDIAFMGGGYGGLLQGNGDGTFSFVNTVNTPKGSAVIAADLNGDGKLDLLGVPCYTFLGNGDGTFQALIQSGGPVNCWGGSILGDVNGDGIPDLTSVASAPILFAFGNGDGTFENPGDLGGIPTTGPTAMGDFNGDGLVDAAVVTFGATEQLTIWLQTLLPYLDTYPASLTFNTQVGMTSPPQTVRLTNNDTVVVTISNISFDVNPPVFTETNNCGSTLAVKASCFVKVTFTPTAMGTFSGQMSIANSSSSGPAEVSLTGNALIGEATLVPTNLTFPNQALNTKSASQNVKLTNSGNGTLTIANVTISPSDFGMVNGCPSTLATGANCTIAVYFDPTATGTTNGSLTITDNAPGSPQNVTLIGTGVQVDFTLYPTSQTTATVTPGQVAKYSVEVGPVNGFNQTLSFTCSGAPPQSTCTVTPNSITLNGVHAQSANIAVVTAGSSAALNPPLGGLSIKLAAVLAMLGSVLGFVAMPETVNTKRRRRRAQFLGGLFILCLVSFVLLMPACGGGSGGSGGGGGGGRSHGTPSGTYNLSVTGTFGTGSAKLAHNASFTLIVQ